MPVETLLIGLHAWLGELGALAFIWIFIEIINATEVRIKRARIIALVGLLLIFASWFAGGYYYVNIYGADVKPLIKEGPVPWAHKVVTETKEHVFLFLPSLAILVYGIINKYKNELMVNKNARSAVLILSASVAVIALMMAALGFLISSGFRAALENLVL